MLRKIAITGGIASGKTTVCQFFQELGATVVYADQIVHELLKSDLREKLIQEFGPEIVKNGQIDRQALAHLTFQNPSKLKKLEALIHPLVFATIEEEYHKATGNCFVAEIPLLYEVGAEDTFDTVIAIVTDEKIAKKRFKHGENEYALRMNRQLKPEEKAERADHTIINNSTLEELRQQIIHLHETMC